MTGLEHRAGEHGVKRTAGRPLVNLQWKLFHLGLLIIDELGFVPQSPTRVELLLEVFIQGYGRGSILVTTNLPLDEWTEVFGSERHRSAVDRLTHHVHILEMNGDSYRLKRSRENAASQSSGYSGDVQFVRRPVRARTAPLTPCHCRRQDISHEQLVGTFSLNFDAPVAQFPSAFYRWIADDFECSASTVLTVLKPLKREEAAA